MGLTGSFFFVQNKGTTLEQLQETLNTQPFLQPRKLYSFADPPKLSPGALLAYQSTAAWFPVYEDGLNDDDEHNAMELSRAFGVPAFAFGVMDSDILFVTYCDAAQEITRQWTKGNSPGMLETYFGPEDPETWMKELRESFGDDVPEELVAPPTRSPQTLPDFLLDFGDPDQLRAAWEEDVVFAEDRAYTLCTLIGTVPLFCEAELPEGWQTLYPIGQK